MNLNNEIICMWTNNIHERILNRHRTFNMYGMRAIPEDNSNTEFYVVYENGKWLDNPYPARLSKLPKRMAQDNS